MDVEGTILPITYRPIVLFTIGILGWALNLLLLSKCGIDPISLLQLHQADNHAPLYKPIFYISFILATIEISTLMLFWQHPHPFIAMMPYISAAIVLFWPGKALYRKERVRFIRMLKRVLSFDLFAPVFFSDIILADLLTSFSNVFGDFFIATCVIFTGHNSDYFMDNSKNIFYRDIIVPLLISVPYLIRLRQCISEYIESKQKRHLFNALKYASSIPVIVFSAIQRKASMYVIETGTVPQHWYMKESTIFRSWILFGFVNSLYSFWWDISMDWGLLSISSKTPQQDRHSSRSINLAPLQYSTPIISFRKQLYFQQPMLYVSAIFLDFLLRINWSLKLSSLIYIQQLEGSVFFIELLEVFRRWVWVIFRLESEWVKKVYSSLPSSSSRLENLRMNMLDRKVSSSLLSPITEEDSP